MSRANDLFTAWWQVLDADTALQALLTHGTVYRFGEKEKIVSLEFKPASCPMFVCAPDDAGIVWRPARRRRGPDVRDSVGLRIEMATEGPDVSKILALAEGLRNAIEADFAATPSVLSALYVDEVEWVSPTLTMLQDDKAALVVGWSFSVGALCRFREGV